MIRIVLRQAITNEPLDQFEVQGADDIAPRLADKLQQDWDTLDAGDSITIEEV